MARKARTMQHQTTSDFGTGAIPVVVEEIAVAPNSRATFKRARRADPLDRVADATPGHKLAASIFRQAVEHTVAGRGMGPMPWAADRVQEGRRGDGLGVSLLPQERALSAAEWHRRGVQAMGLAAAEGVVNWVVIRGGTLADYDEVRRWRRHTARGQLLAALDRLAEAYGVA